MTKQGEFTSRPGKGRVRGPDVRLAGKEGSSDVLRDFLLKCR